MGGFFQNLIIRFRRFMQGRYGSDNLSLFIISLALLFWIVNTFLGRRILVLSLIPTFLIAIYFFRMFSQNIQARYNENTRYLMIKNKVLGLFKGKGSGAGSARSGNRPGAGGNTASATHKIFLCPGCKQKVRVPAGKGKIEITCPRCGNHFKRRT